VQQIQVQVVRAEPSKAPLAGAADPRRIGMRGQRLSPYYEPSWRARAMTFSATARPSARPATMSLR
jgi:hypothetical protein